MYRHMKPQSIINTIFLTAVSVYSFRLFIPHDPGFIWFIIAVLTYSCFSGVHLQKMETKTIISAAVLGFLLSLMCFFSYQLKLNNAIYFDIQAIISALGLALFFFYALAGIFFYLLNHPRLSTYKSVNNAVNRRVLLFFISFIVILACWTPYFIACFPGNLTSDSIGEIRQQLGLSPLSNHHPVIHQIMIRLCMLPWIHSGNIQNGVILYTVLQMIFTAAIFSYCIVFMASKHVPKKALFCILLFYSCYTINGFFSVTMYKDVPFAGIVLLFSIFLVNELCDEYNQKGLLPDKLNIVILVVLAFLFCTVRNNGYYAFIIGFIFIILFNLKHFRRLLVIFIATLLLVNSYYFILFNITGAKKSASGEMLGLPLHMIARVVKEDNPDLSAEDFIIIKEVIPDYQVLADNYVPDNSDPIKGNGVFLADAFDKNPVRYLKSWLKIGLQYPRTYIDAFLLHTQGFWDVNKNSSTISAYVYDNEFGITQSERSEPLRVFLINLHTFLSNNSIISPFYSIGFMVVLFLFSFVLLLIKGQLQVASPIFILAALWLTVIAGPCCLYHYVYGLTVTIPLFLSLALILPRRNNHSHVFPS